jgi:hypothetical protein
LKKTGILKILFDARQETRSSASSHLLFWLSITLASGFLYLTLREMDWNSFFTTLRKAHYAFLPLLSLWTSLTLLFRAARWRVLLSYEKHIPFWNVFFANSAGYFGNNIFPARAGEIVRAVYLGKQNSMSISFTLTTGLVERFSDLIALLVIGSLSLTSAGILEGTLRTGLVSMSMLGGLGLALILTLPYWNPWAASAIDRLPMPGNLKHKLLENLEQFLGGIKSLRNLNRASIFLLYTCIIWFMDALGMMFVAMILNLSLAIQPAFVLLSTLGLSSALPSTPGYIGVYQFAAFLALQPFGFSKAESVALVLFAQIANFLVISFWGILALARFPQEKTTSAKLQ